MSGGEPPESLATGTEAILGRWAGADGSKRPPPEGPEIFDAPTKIRLTNNVLRADHCSYQVKNIAMTTIRGHRPSNSPPNLALIFGVTLLGLMFMASERQVGPSTTAALAVLGLPALIYGIFGRKSFGYSLRVQMTSGSELVVKSLDEEFIKLLGEKINEVMEVSSKPADYRIDVGEGTVDNVVPLAVGAQPRRPEPSQKPVEPKSRVLRAPRNTPLWRW